MDARLSAQGWLAAVRVSVAAAGSSHLTRQQRSNLRGADFVRFYTPKEMQSRATFLLVAFQLQKEAKESGSNFVFAFLCGAKLPSTNKRIRNLRQQNRVGMAAMLFQRNMAKIHHMKAKQK